MPIYEYQCQKCEAVEEVLMRFADPEPSACSACGGPVRKLMSQTSFALKGSGWYVTDYKGGGAAKADAPPPAATAAQGASEQAKPAADASSSNTSNAAAKESSSPAETKAATV